MKDILIVGLGGFFGSISRYGIGVYSSKLILSQFPIGTITVNLVGSLLIGLLAGYFIKNQASQALSLLLITGFCGGFTTFSTFSLDNMKLIKEGFYLQFALYGIGSVIIGLVLCMLGILLTSKS
ncbi:MAG: fluoride efflux transporter CrcB [Cyclobacteriaceae bacterium]